MTQGEAVPARRFTGANADVWNDIVGPVYNAEDLHALYGLTRRKLAAMSQADEILALETADGGTAYPANLLDEGGQGLPRLPDVIAGLRSWGRYSSLSAVMWLNDHRPEWDGHTAIELLKTEWADEIVEQSRWRERAPLDARRRRAELMDLARPILDRFVELVADLPVDVAEETLLVTLETDVPYGIFLMAVTTGDGRLSTVSFEVDENVEASAQGMADDLRTAMKV